MKEMVEGSSSSPEQGKAKKVDDIEETEPAQAVSSSSSSSSEDEEARLGQKEELDRDRQSNSNKVEEKLHQEKPREELPRGKRAGTGLAVAGGGTWSRLFAPFRSVGVVAGAAPFHLHSHQNSQTSTVCCAIGDRFQLVRTDRLQPVLVSQAAPRVAVSGRRGRSSSRGKASAAPRCIRLVRTDPSLSITVAAHGSANSDTADTVTLFHRTRPVDSKLLVGSSVNWRIRDMVSTGRVAVPKINGEGTEQAAVVIVVLSKTAEREEGDSVPVVGDDDDDDSDDSSTSSSSSSDSDESDSSSSSDSDREEEEEERENCLGRVVVLLATRSALRVLRRIPLTAYSTFRPVSMLHPATYVNKLLLAGEDSGRPAACLVNIRSQKVIHVFNCLGGERMKGNVQPVIVTALEQSPAVDTVAMGTNHGVVHLVNLRHDKKLFSLKHASDSGARCSITSISFRTDGSAMQYGIAPMAVGRSDGTVTVWDLTPPDNEEDGRTVLCEMHRVHPGGISKLQYLAQEPLLLSTGVSSNAMIMHIFDTPDHSGRVLRQRKGHTAPPRIIRYLHDSGSILMNAADGTDASSCQILSSGGPDRTLRVFSTARSVLDREYSQGQGLEKRARQLGLRSTAELLLPPVIALATTQARSRDWGDLVTVHQKHSFAYVWSTKRGAQTGPVLRQSDWNVSAMQQPPPVGTQACSVAVSACGNFALVGTRGGTIYKYNIQSGLPRGSYPKDATVKEEGRQTKPRAIGDVNRTMKALEKKSKSKNNRPANLDKRELDYAENLKREQRLRAKLRLAAHTGHAVTGLAVDSLNKTLVSVGADAKLILWNFLTHAPHKKSPYSLPSPATKLCHVRDSDLAAIALGDCSVLLFDCSALSVVRRFGFGVDRHTGAINDLAFSPDGRSLYTASLDGTIRVWDVPTSTCVDWLGFKDAPTSLAVSPTGEFLATTHVGKLGISVWSDRSFYQTVHANGVALTEPARMDEPIPVVDALDRGESDQQVSADASSLDEQGAEGKEVDKVPSIPKEDGLITLSGLPPAHWKNLFHLELVKERNKPKEPPKKPPSAPFFLQWRGGEPLAEPPKEENEKKADGQEEEEWAAAWSDDDEGREEMIDGSEPETDRLNSKRERSEGHDKTPNKRQKIKQYRSHLASLLERCSKTRSSSGQRRFQAVTDYIASLGPSAIDVELSALCSGMHDLEEGLPQLLFACQWLLEACQSRERFEAVNAYLHRFLYLHASVIIGVKEKFRGSDPDQEAKISPEEINEEQRLRRDRLLLIEFVSQLKRAQKDATEALREKMEHTLCLLRHFSRMI